MIGQANMEFVASIIDNVFRPLKDFFARSFGYVASCGDYVAALADEMNELKSKRDDVKRMVDAAERQGMEPTSQARNIKILKHRSLTAQAGAGACMHACRE